MKKLFKYEINESIAAKAAMNCVHKRLFKELYMGRPEPQEEVVRGDYDPYEWEFDDYGNEDKRQLVIQALVQAGFIQSEQEGLSLNNKIQQLLDKTNFSVSNAQDAMTFVKSYGRQIVGETQEQEESTYNEKEAIAKQVMANYNPDTDEYEDPEVWLRYAIQEHIGKQFLKMPKKEVKAWQRAIESTINEYEFEKQHPSHYEHPEDEDRLQSQLANAWDEGMADDEDDYVPYENKFDETHNDIVDSLLTAVDWYFRREADVEGFNHFQYTEDQIGKAVEQILDKYGDFPSSNNSNKCHAWVKKHAEEIIKALENGSLDNSYEGHPEFNFSEQEEDYSDDSHGIEIIIDLMVAKQLISDGERTRQIAKELIERKLDEEGMWIGDDEHEAERFVEFFGEDIAEETEYWRW